MQKCFKLRSAVAHDIVRHIVISAALPLLSEAYVVVGKHSAAAVIKSVPGAWRSHGTSTMKKEGERERRRREDHGFIGRGWKLGRGLAVLQAYSTTALKVAPLHSKLHKAEENG